VKDLINEMLKVFGVNDKTADDLFYFDTFLEDTDMYKERGEDDEDEENVNDMTKDVDIKELINDVLTQKVEKPTWMKDAEDKEDSYDYYKPSTELYIKAKDEKHLELANKLLKYLNSTDHEATRDG
jgi:hypothetical protein